MNLAIAIASLLSFLPAKDLPMAVVVRVKGHATAGPAKALKPLKPGDVVSRNWQIKTESDGRVLLRFLSDKALADIKASTLIELDVRADKTTASVQDVTVHGGEVAFAIATGLEGDRAQTATTVTTAKIAQFGMSTTSEGTTRVDVLTGTVQVCNQMTGEHRQLTSGQSQISGYDGFDELRPMPADSSLGRMDVSLPVVDTLGGGISQLQVPFIDPVTGKSATLTIGVKRGR